MKRPLRFKFVGKLEQIRMEDSRFSRPRGLFLDCYIDDEYIRSHLWVALSKKVLKIVKRGYWINCSVETYKYIDIDTLKCDKVGVCKLSDISISKDKPC